ncbi:hypothetical protein H632_c2449p1 [Helicosporidium sp. ATCC 50920]|nr:hypothetical protein H632_c2449p1 [Helicosporidium sp. ATCC 50920]|eukprot:KDD73185.1 hypothetical protein H632_c2449p1 [Helicosporidium sp. ATCC 50920]
MEGRAYAQCTACSETVVREYRRRGLDFVLEALESPSSIEDLTGLTTLHREAQAALEAMETLEPDEDEAWDAL